MTLTIKIDGENFMELPLMGNAELLIEDRLIWKTEKASAERTNFVKGDKLRVNYLSYQDYKVVHSIFNNNRKDYNNTILNIGDIVTFKAYSNASSSCETTSSWVFIEEDDEGILDILCEKI